MDGRIVLSQAEVIEALRAALGREPGPEEAWTREDLQNLTGWSYKKLQLAIRRLVMSGAWEHVEVRRPNVVGHVVPVPAYRPKTPTS